MRATGLTQTAPPGGLFNAQAMIVEKLPGDSVYHATMKTLRVSLLLGYFICLSATARALVNPADVGMNPAKLRDIQPRMQKLVDEHKIAGAVTLVASKGQIVHHQAVGYASLEKQTPMRDDSMFWIASMTKPITALAVMMLQDEGKLSIDDPVEKHLPEFAGQMMISEKSAEGLVLIKPKRAVTIKDLLTHMSGLVSKSPLEQEALDKLTLREAVLTYALSPLQFEPGTKWSYCNPGITTLGRIVEVVSGKPFATFMDQRIFKPLGMKDTTFWPNGAQMKRIATAYKNTADDKALEPVTITYLSEPYSNRKRMPLPAGGLFSTAGDVGKLYLMLLAGGEVNGKHFISEAALKQMITNHSGDLKAGFADGMGMGLGFQVVREPTGVTAMLSPGSFGHGGAYGTQSWLDPVKQTVYITLIQRAGLKSGDQSEMRLVFQEAAAAAIMP